jgi:hypothetical protein
MSEQVLDAPVPAVEAELAFDMVKRSLPFVPVAVAIGLLLRGGDGAWSTLVAVAIVLVNLIGSALALGWAARRGAAALMATALGGFLARMLLLTLVVWAVKDSGWIDLPTLAVAVLATHLGLLFWEARYVSANLAYPALRPRPKEASVP